MPLKENDPRLAPDFKPSMKRDLNGEYIPMYKGNDCGQRRIATRQEDGEFGEINDVAVPHLPYEKWIDNTGQQINLVIGNNRDPRRVSASNAQYVRLKMRQSGGFPYHYRDARKLGFAQDCPEEEWEEKRDAMAAKLREKHNRRQARFRDVGKSEFQKFLDAQAAQSGASDETKRAISDTIFGKGLKKR